MDDGGLGCILGGEFLLKRADIFAGERVKRLDIL
jgi:hypothetical protein